MQEYYSTQLKQAQCREELSAQELNLQCVTAENNMSATVASLRTRLLESQEREKSLQDGRVAEQNERPSSTRMAPSPIPISTPPRFPEASGPPRTFGRTSEPSGQHFNIAGGDSGNTNVEPGPGNETPRQNGPISSTARGDSGGSSRLRCGKALLPGAARGDPSRRNDSVPEPTALKEEPQSSWFARLGAKKIEPQSEETPHRLREPVQEEAEITTPGVSSMNIYKERQAMSFLNWPDVRGFGAWKITFTEKLPPNIMNQEKS